MRHLTAVLVFVSFLCVRAVSGQSANPGAAPGGFVELEGSRLYYEECGSGPDAVVLLHDGGANSGVWNWVWPLFCQRFHTIRYDRRGFGHSPETTKPYYEANDVAALLRDRKISRAALIASSHGGEVAMNFALRYGEQVSDLVLVGPAASGFAYSEHFLLRERDTWHSNKVDELIEATLHDPYLIVPSHDEAHKRLRDLLSASPQDLTHTDMPLPEKPVLPRLHELHMPTLILVGSADIADNHAVSGALVMAIPQAMRIVVPDTGHLMYLEKPEVFFGLVDRFLTAHRFPTR